MWTESQFGCDLLKALVNPGSLALTRCKATVHGLFSIQRIYSLYTTSYTWEGKEVSVNQVLLNNAGGTLISAQGSVTNNQSFKSACNKAAWETSLQTVAAFLRSWSRTGHTSSRKKTDNASHLQSLWRSETWKKYSNIKRQAMADLVDI